MLNSKWRRPAFALFVLLLSAALPSLRAQQQNVIKYRPLSAIAYERMTAEHQSAELSFNYFGFSGSGPQFGFGGDGSDAEFSFSNRMVLLHYRFFLQGNREGLEGFYLSPFGYWLNISGDLTDTNDSGSQGAASANTNSFGLGGSLGGQYIFESGFVLEWFAGLGFGSLSPNTLSITYADGETGSIEFPLGFIAFPRLGLSLGYAF